MIKCGEEFDLKSCNGNKLDVIAEIQEHNILNLRKKYYLSQNVFLWP